jgi:hypothetical protein
MKDNENICPYCPGKPININSVWKTETLHTSSDLAGFFTFQDKFFLVER